MLYFGLKIVFTYGYGLRVSYWCFDVYGCARLVVLIGIWFVVVLDCIWFRATTGGVGFIFGGLVAGWLVFRL